MGVALRKYMFFFGLMVVVLASYLLASLGSFLIARQFPDDVIMPSSSQIEDLSSSAHNHAALVDPMAIVKRNFFDPEETVLTDQTSTEVAVATDTGTDTGSDETVEDPTKKAAVKTSLPLQLLAATPFGSGENDISSCVLAAGKEIDTYTRQKNPSNPPIKIVRILPRRVEFINSANNRFEFVEIVDFAKGMDTTAKPDKPGKSTTTKKTVKSEVSTEISGDGERFTIPRSEIDKAINDVGKLFTEIRAVPFMEDGQTNGLKLLSVKQGSIFEKLGLKRGDILKSINNNVIDIPTASKLFEQLKDETQITLDITRQGTAKVLTYDII